MSDRIALVGTIATDPSIIGGGSPTQLCTFRLASNDRWFDRDKNEWVDGPTNWYTINAFRGLGEHAKASLGKGERIMVQGRLRVRRWETNEKRGISVEVDADALGHDLRWGTSSFTKLSRPGNAPGGEPAGEAAPEQDPAAVVEEPAPF